MDKSNKTKLIIVSIILACTGGYLYMSEGATATDDAFEKRMAMLNKKPTTTTHSAPAKQTTLPSRRAPENSEILTASLLISQATNKEAEKQWIDFRLGTRVARENAAREEAELKEQQHKLARLKVLRRIDALANGASLDEEGEQNKSDTGNPATLAIGPQEPETKEVVDIELLSVHKGKSGYLATLKIDGKIFKNISKSRVVRGFHILNVDNDDCVSLNSEDNVFQKLCIE